MSTTLSKDVVFQEILAAFKAEPKITSLAENARSFYYYCKKANVTSSCFPMLGSMGQELSMGLGIALGNNKKAHGKTVVISSDGSLFSNINTLVTIGVLKPSKLLILVLDNEVHGITGGQPSASKFLSISRLASSCNIDSFEVRELVALKKILKLLKKKKGPTLVNIKISRKKAKFENITALPSALYKQFSEYLCETS